MALMLYKVNQACFSYCHVSKCCKPKAIEKLQT